jgi:hypothetical protein
MYVTYIMEISIKKIRATIMYNYQKSIPCMYVSNRPIGENSPNLVTQLETEIV